MKILIIANARYKGGLSGSDAIYENFIKYWGGDFDVQTMLEIDYKPFWLCYINRIFLGCFRALFNFNRYDFVYSASDFLPDVLPAAIYRIKGAHWIAGFYLQAFRENRFHYYTQKFVKLIIDKFADMVIVANPTMYDIFLKKKKTWINGGVDLSLAGLSNKPKIYDAVFCGRIHPSKGIDELIDIWGLVRRMKSDATLAIIGDGDLGKQYIIDKLKDKYGGFIGITLYGYMGNERFDIYKKSRIVLYPTPLKYEHFSMAPVEAMACGCPMVTFNLPIMKVIWPAGTALAKDKDDFSKIIIALIQNNPQAYQHLSALAFNWAQQFDYKKQVIKVYEDICREIKI